MKNKLIYLRIVAVLSVAVALLSGCGNAELIKRQRPNFLFILLDDQPYDAFSYSGRYPFLKTPNIDRIAREGAWFDNVFCTAALCSPSRASFLTGTYPHVNGVTQNDPRVDPDWVSFPPYTVLLREAGYETAMIGKIHMKHLKGKDHIRPGFDYWLSFQGQGEYFDPLLNENGREFIEKGYITDILTRYAVDWLKNKRDRSKPFSMCVWHKAVHEPYSPAIRHQGIYKDESLPEPPYGTAYENFLGKPEWQRIKAYDHNWKNYTPVLELPVKKWDPKNQRFLSLLESTLAVDESTGELLKTLSELGELDNTVIIYSSDNGYFMGEHTYWDKRIAYESSMRIPLLIRFPEKIAKGTVVDELCLNIDVAPTLLELADVEIPSYIQGESLLPLLRDKTADEWRKSVLFEYYVDDAYPYAGPDLLAIRSDSFKLVDCFLENDIDELYDLKNDPGEMKNLINDTAYYKVQERLRLEIEQLKLKFKYTGDRDWWLRQAVLE
jgi:N-acetylglucosamine-6-sulfatase